MTAKTNTRTTAPEATPNPAATVHPIEGGGRTATGDRRPVPKAQWAAEAQPAVEAQPAPEAKVLMGMSGYRIKCGTSDAAIVAAIRSHAATMCEAEDAGGWDVIQEATTDEELIGLIAWSVIPKTAISRVQKHLTDLARLTC